MAQSIDYPEEMKRLYDESAQLRNELERAYRCISAFYTSLRKGEFLDKTALAYHSPTIAAARRYVAEGELDGAQYFIGKNVSVMHAALDL